MTDIKRQIHELIEKGDDEALGRFAIENFSALPRDMQKHTLFAAFESALEQVSRETLVARIELELFGALEKLSALKAALER